MSSDLSHPQRHKGGIGPGPGPKLKAARIKAGLDVAEIAAQLRLRRKVVEDLENNNYDALPASVFVQGYYRNMAEALGLSKDEVVQAYFQAINLTRNEPAPEPAKPVQEPPKAASDASQEGSKGFMGRLSTGFKSLGSKGDGQQDSPQAVQDLSQPRQAPKARPISKTREEPQTTAAAAGRTEPRVEPNLELSRELDRDSHAHEDSGFETEFDPAPRARPRPESRTETRPEPRMDTRLDEDQDQYPEPRQKPRAFRPGARPQRQATPLDDRDYDDHAEPPRSFRPRGVETSFSMPRISLGKWLPQNPGLLLRRTGLFIAVLAVIGLVGWGISLIPMRGLVDDLMHKWSALIDSPKQESQSIPPQLAEDEGQTTPTSPSADTQLLEPPPLSDTLTDFEGSLGSAPEAAEETPAEPKSTKGPHKIVVELKGVSWVEIEDATKEYRLVGELQKGSTHELKGSPPYKILFGRGNLVKLTVDGKNYDFSKHQQGSVARFTLDP